MREFPGVTDINTSDEYISPNGWCIDLPPGWELLEMQQSMDPLVPLVPLSFGFSGDWSIVLTWKVAPEPLDDNLTGAFFVLTMLAGPAPMPDTEVFLQRIGVTIGDIDTAAVIELPDGTRALEVEEKFSREGENRAGYHLLMPFQQEHGDSIHLQEFSFYAPVEKYNDFINQVRATANSIRYE